MTRLAAALALASAVMTVVVVRHIDQGFYSDPAFQMIGAIQYLSGESSQANALVQPGPADISRDYEEAMIEYAPGAPLAFVPLLRSGRTPAASGRAIVALALIAGSIGWATWFAGFDLPAPFVVAFALVVPWMRFASNALFWFTPEVLIFACTPWVLVAAVAAERNTRAPLTAATALGLLAGALYVVKFSAVFVTVGVCVWFAWRMWRADGPWMRRLARVAALGVGAAIPIAALTLFNSRHGRAANLMFDSFTVRWHWIYIVHAIGSCALTLADLDSLLTYLLMHPVHGVTQNVLWVSLCGLPGGILLIVLASRARYGGARADLARSLFASTIAAALMVWTLSATVSIEARHLFSGGFAMLPLALAEGRAWWRSGGATARRLLATAAIVFVVAPLSYGVVSVFAKVNRYPSDYRPAPSGTYNPLLAQHDAASVVAALNRMYDPAADVWYLPEPLSALDISGRSILRVPDFAKLEEIRSERFLTSRRVRIRALMPPRFELNGKAAAIRASFPQATGWTHATVAGSEYDVWTTVLEPDLR